MADLSYFTPRVLTGIINLRPVKHDLFASFFKPQSPSPTDVLELQTSLRGRAILPSVSNYAGGTVLPSDTLSVSYVKAPRFRPKRAFRAADLMHTQAGRTPYDPRINPVEEAVARDMDAHREDIDRMTEIMCAQAIVNGVIDLYDVIDGEYVKTFSVDFNRPASHYVELTGDDQWSNKDSDILGQVEDAYTLIQEDTSGLGASDLILGKNAWKYFMRHPQVFNFLDNRRMEIGDMSPSVGRKLKGVWNGMNIWVDNGTYVGLDKVAHYYIEPDYAVMLARDAESVLEFGQPIDVQCEGPATIFAKQYEQEDPSGIFTVAESRPLPVTRHTGWTVLFKPVGDSSDGDTGDTGGNTGDDGGN